MIHIEEAKTLLDTIQKASQAFAGCQNFQESEVQFRWDGILAMLAMAQNDVKQMIQVWTEYHRVRTITCPWCGDKWNDENHLYDDSPGETLHCFNCGNEVFINAYEIKKSSSKAVQP